MDEKLLQKYMEEQNNIIDLLQHYEENETNNNLFLALLQNINDIDASIQEQYILPFIIQLFASNASDQNQSNSTQIGSELFYNLALVMSDFFDESPQFTAAFQISIAPLFDLKYDFFKYPSMLYLFFKNKRCDIQQCITQIYAMLSHTDQNQVIQAINSNNNSKYTIQAIILIICACDSAVYSNNQTQINLIVQFLLSGIFSLNNLYIDILQTIMDQFNDGDEGIFIIFNQLSFIKSQIMNVKHMHKDEIYIQYQVMYVGILSLLAVEQNGFLSGNNIVNSVQVIQYVKQLLLNTGFNLNDNNRILLLNQVIKLLRNCGMHQGFQLQQNYIDLYQILWTLSAAVLNFKPQDQKIQIQLLQQTILSFVITFIYNQQAVNILSSQFVVQFNEETLQVQQNTEIQQIDVQEAGKQISIAFTSILQASLQLSWEDHNDFEIFKQYFKDMYEQNLLDTLNQQLVMQVVNQLSQIYPDDSSDLSDY